MDKIKEIFEYWNDKKIIMHRKLTKDMQRAVLRALQDYEVEEIKAFIDFYATILEASVPDEQRKYFWTYKWGLCEFMSRGLKKFDGQGLENYQRKQKVEAPEAIIMKRS